jgi:hypothetical protein
MRFHRGLPSQIALLTVLLGNLPLAVGTSGCGNTQTSRPIVDAAHDSPGGGSTEVLARDANAAGKDDANADAAGAGDSPREDVAELPSNADTNPDNMVAKADASVPSFTALPSLRVPRTGHTVTALADGKVLVVGGQYDLYDSKSEYYSTTKVTGTAEVYDPQTETFTATGSLASPRAGHTATLLVDGRILIAGGYGEKDFAATAEIYDPASGTFRLTGTMLTPRTGATATLLDDGEVLLAGGSNTGELARCEVYSPESGTFTATGSMSSARRGHTATLLADGKVLLVGGDAYNLQDFVTAELFNPANGTFFPTGALAARRDGHTATRLADGRVLIVGGEGDGDPSRGEEDLATSEIYDPDKGAFSMTGSLATQRFGHSATLLANGKVLIAGGMNHLATATYLSSAELFDPAKGTFSSVGSLVGMRTSHRAVGLPSGKVLLVGGSQNPNSAEVFDPAAGIFYSRDLPRSYHTATVLGNGKVLLSAQPDPMNDFAVENAVLYDPVARIFTATGAMVRARRCHAATRLLDGRVFFAGSGPWTNTPALLRTELYDPVAGTFTATPTMTSRCGLTATLLTDGRVFLAGGSTNDATTAVFDVAANTMSTTVALGSARQGHTATLLPNGTVLLVGGWGDQYKTLAGAEIFTPSTGTVAPAGAMASPRTGHTATTLPDGRVLIVGGWSGVSSASGNYSGKPLATSELYDPTLGVFQPSGSMATARFSHAAAPLPDGRVLIVGGSDSVDPSRNSVEPHPLASAEIFDPATGTFAPAPSLTMPRVGATLTPLPNGDMLVVGGNAAGLDGHETIARVEIFR